MSPASYSGLLFTPPRQPADKKCCQVNGCSNPLPADKLLYRRFKICREHANATQVLLPTGGQHRWCQQCRRFQPLAEFDGVKRSCRATLARHNERRRQSAPSKNRTLPASEATSPDLAPRSNATPASFAQLSPVNPQQPQALPPRRTMTEAFPLSPMLNSGLDSEVAAALRAGFECSPVLMSTITLNPAHMEFPNFGTMPYFCAAGPRAAAAAPASSSGQPVQNPQLAVHNDFSCQRSGASTHVDLGSEPPSFLDTGSIDSIFDDLDAETAIFLELDAAAAAAVAAAHTAKPGDNQTMPYGGPDKQNLERS